jgi:hypothetical protein
VDACTVAAPDAVIAFAVPNPGCSSQNQSVFSGLVARRSPCRADHSAYFGVARFISPILSAVDASQIKQSLHRCQRNSQGENEISVHGIVENVDC